MYQIYFKLQGIEMFARRVLNEVRQSLKINSLITPQQANWTNYKYIYIIDIRQPLSALIENFNCLPEIIEDFVTETFFSNFTY